MSVSFHRGGWEARWRDADGRRRAPRFATGEETRAFDDALADLPRAVRIPPGTAVAAGSTRTGPPTESAGGSSTDEIPRYLYGCSDVYRPLAELLIGSGVRISEALALRFGDLELEPTGGTIVVYRSRKIDGIGSTKSDRFRAVEIGQGLASVRRDQVALRAEVAAGDRAAAAPFVRPVRTTKRSNGRWETAGVGQPLDRTTVSRDWHKHALEDAALRDMPLHALRHTAAAAWLAAGNSLMYVQRQLVMPTSARRSAAFACTCSR